MRIKTVVLFILFLAALPLADAAWGGVAVEMHGTDELLMTVDGETFLMRLVISASGAKYEAVDDPTTVFWRKGDTAFVYVRDREYLVDGAPPVIEITIRPADIPIGVSWTVRSIAGEPLVPGSAVTIRFDHNARLSGRASVNMYQANWIATGNRLLIKTAAATRMAAAQDLMDQENKFLALLEDVSGYEIRGDTLILTTRDGTEIEAGR